eukprot:6819347-Prymnesium_polylepis.1
MSLAARFAASILSAAVRNAVSHWPRACAAMKVGTEPIAAASVSSILAGVGRRSHSISPPRLSAPNAAAAAHMAASEYST